jgi:hypothetical protein
MLAAVLSPTGFCREGGMNTCKEHDRQLIVSFAVHITQACLHHAYLSSDLASQDAAAAAVAVAANLDVFCGGSSSSTA